MTAGLLIISAIYRTRPADTSSAGWFIVCGHCTPAIYNYKLCPERKWTTDVTAAICMDSADDDLMTAFDRHCSVRPPTLTLYGAAGPVPVTTDGRTLCFRLPAGGGPLR